MFFFDANLSATLVKGMRGFGEECCHLSDHFEKGALDTEWPPEIGTRGWLLVTRDLAIRRNPAELSALTRYGVGAFFIGGKKQTRCDLVEQVVRNWRTMKQLAHDTARPFAFRVPPKGGRLKRLTL